MKFLGGKSRIGYSIANYINLLHQERGQEVLEPFCGGLNVTRHIKGPRIASDVHITLILLYQAMQQGWEPPDTVSEGQYAYYKDFGNPSDPMTAFIGYGCSFSGKWFGGYARGDGRNFADEARRSLLSKMTTCKDATFEFNNYKYLTPKNKLIYCDPPYADTTEYQQPFNNEEFWEIMRVWSRDNTVLISEYKAPEDFVCIMDFPTYQSVSKEKERPLVTEKLFVMKGSNK
jgi:DNA adenine methylase